MGELLTLLKALHVPSTLMLVLISLTRGGVLATQGPVFLFEPPYKISFSNTTGGSISCTGAGQPVPEIEWTPPINNRELADVLPNGTLIFYPFAVEKYQHELHTSVYRCKLKNSIGIALSREVHVKAVINQKYAVQVHNEYVIVKNTAVIKCQVPSFMADYVKITAWQVNRGGLNPGSPEGFEFGMQIYPNTEIGGKYVMSNGDLYITNVEVSDSHPTYRCKTTNILTNEIQTSAYPAKIIVTEPKGFVQPRINVEKQSVKHTTVNGQITLPCIAQGYPPPSYRWFKEENERLVPLQYNDRIYLITGGLLKIAKVRLEDNGKFLCLVNNSAGEETIQITLMVSAPLSVHLQPDHQTVDVDKNAEFQCIISGTPVEKVIWLHDGKPLSTDNRVEINSDPPRILIKRIQKEDQGMYQCIVSNEWEQLQSTSELQLGDASPELLYHFTEQTMQPGPMVSLKCVAVGSPIPQFAWRLDGFPVPEHFLIGQYVTVHDDVISHLNISNIRTEDGGEYSCIAQNSIGKVMHSARISVYGNPFIREMPRTSAVGGSDLIIKCPVAGYPIDQIQWERDGQVLPVNRRQRTFPNGTLVIEQLQRNEDAGTYTCMAQNKQGQSSRRNVEVQVLIPPKIMPIPSMTNMYRDGMRATIPCSILEGDLPLSFRWERNGKQVFGTGNEIIRHLDSYSSNLIIEKISSDHSGNYTCIAQNNAGAERLTVPLTVNVPPKWIVEPKDTSTRYMDNTTIDCEADGQPKPTITWKKAVGNQPGDYKDFLFESKTSLLPNGSLTFYEITKLSQSYYLCEAKNGIGSGVSKVIYLKVNVPAHFKSKKKQILIAKGKQVHLQCNAAGDTPISISWRLQSSQDLIRESADIRFSIREQKLDDGMVSELGISNTYRHDSGIYICSASNAFGHDEVAIELVVQETPEPPKNLRIISQHSRSVQVSWQTPFSGNSPIESFTVQYKPISDSWTIAQKMSIDGSDSQINIINLQPAKAYHARITAENKFGSSDFSEMIQVTTLEEAPSAPPTDVTAEARSSTEIHISWRAPEKEHWNGNLLGYHVGYQQIISSVINKHEISPTPGYSFKIVEIQSQSFGGELVLSGLNKYSAYKVYVQAYTSQGSGPSSKEIIISTLEDVPSVAPETAKCNVLSSTTIYVTWSPVPKEGQNGKILGYKVFYVPNDRFQDTDELAASTTNQFYTIENALKFTNYTIKIVAYTKIGDGLRTNSIYCMTHEDVPSAPQNVKAIPSSSTKIIISWLPPEYPNGEITGYTLYMAVVEGGRDEGTHKRVLNFDIDQHEIQRFQEHATYQFWMTASTKIGEGEKTKVSTVPPNNKVPARIVSFGRIINSPWKEDIILECKKVGVPTPSILWQQNSAPLATSPKKMIAKNGTLIIRDCQRADEANYSCSVENTWGEDTILYSLKVFVPPEPPTLLVIDIFSDSLLLEWTDNKDGGSSILGYVINYKRENGDWEELQISSKLNSYLLSNLWCGTKYQLYITAYNKIGNGLPCDIMNTQTKGYAPVHPKHSQMITNNSTSVTCWLDSWGDGGCGISYFIIESRLSGRSHWNTVNSHVPSTDRIYTISDLMPKTKYQVKVTAMNNAGSSTAVYDFTTLTAEGLIFNADDPDGVQDGNEFTLNYRVIIPIVLSFVILAIIGSIIFMIHRRKTQRQNAILAASHSETPSISNVMGKSHLDGHNASAISSRIQNSNLSFSSADSSKFKIEGNEYIEDLCPYATFQLNKHTYSESSYSGNVYSGPYHSVRGSFVYHDNKSENYRTKEPEYTKVRRAGSRLRDDGHDMQFLESDNPGSTDSEVRKILSLHIPITEYDTLGSESDNECSAKSVKQTKFKSQRENIHESSSSSENSPSNALRKHKASFSSRKTAKSSASASVSGSGGVVKQRHVRSSSGYSSHNDETTFSISNYPSTFEIGPPSRFQDVSCDSSYEKRDKNTNSPRVRSNQKFQREAFQINV